MRKTLKRAASAFIICTYFFVLCAANVNFAYAATSPCTNGHFNSSGDYVCDGTGGTGQTNTSPIFSTTQGQPANPAPTPQQTPVGNGLIYGASGNDCERQATVSANSLGANGTRATMSVPVAITLNVGDKIVVEGANPQEYNGTFTISSISGSTLTYDLPRAPASSVATGGITVRPGNVATGQSCIDQMTQQMQDLENRIAQLQQQMSASMGQIEPAMQGMSLDQQQNYLQGLQQALNGFLNGKPGSLGSMLGGQSTGGSSPLGQSLSPLGQNANDPSASGDPSTAGASYLAGKGSCNMSEHKPLTSRSPDGNMNLSSSGATCNKGTSVAGSTGDNNNCLKDGGAGDNSTLNQVVTLLQSREGWYNKAYKDSVGKTTIGVGHLCVGDCTMGTVWTNDQVMAAFKKDIATFWNKSLQQMDDLCIDDSCFFAHLVSANYQLGNWAVSSQGHPRFEQVMALMKQGQYTQAANIIQGSWWNRPVKSGGTPVRAQDFIAALKGMVGTTNKCGTKIV